MSRYVHDCENRKESPMILLQGLHFNTELYRKPVDTFDDTFIITPELNHKFW